MTFTSFAQNLEDVMLWRVFKNAKNGFYIDVGANDPVKDSVTKAFYDRGWHGINIEPMDNYYHRLCQERTRDINLPVAAGSEEGLLPYYDIPKSGLSTLDSTTAEQHKRNGWEVITRHITVVPLSCICQEYVKGDIHFLKIDVEGAEKQVLLGMDFRQFRPWIVLVEATIPCTQVENYHDWENILVDGGYQYVYFDGINRFYIANEKMAELKAHFSAPPNFFDCYQRYSEYSPQRQDSLEGILKRLIQENQKLLRERKTIAREYQILVQQKDMLMQEVLLLLTDLSEQKNKHGQEAIATKNTWEKSFTSGPRAELSDAKYDEVELMIFRLRQEISHKASLI